MKKNKKFAKGLKQAQKPLKALKEEASKRVSSVVKKSTEAVSDMTAQIQKSVRDIYKEKGAVAAVCIPQPPKSGDSMTWTREIAGRVNLIDHGLFKVIPGLDSWVNPPCCCVFFQELRHAERTLVSFPGSTMFKL